jgi:hypothetical protein
MSIKMSPGIFQFRRRRVFMTMAVLALFLCAISAGAASPEERYAEVRETFEKSDFTGAESLAETMLKDGLLSPQLFQLLGHIRYRQGDLGGASLWYTRASLFPPPVPEIRQNITYIHERTGNLRFAANTLLDQFAARLSRSEWARMGIVSAWVLIFSVAICLLMRSFALRTVLVLVAVIAAGSAAVAGIGWAAHPSYKKIANLAMVTAPGTKAYTAATVTSGTVSALPPGSEVRKLEERGAWCYVEIPANPQTADDSTERHPYRGWVQSSALTSCWPYEAGYLE